MVDMKRHVTLAASPPAVLNLVSEGTVEPEGLVVERDASSAQQICRRTAAARGLGVFCPNG